MKKIILYIGAPGTGKTYRITQLKQQYKDDCIIFTPTNSSAQLCEGQTIYKYFNCTPFNLASAKIKKFKQKYIIIDEVFMFTSDMFDKILQCEPQNLFLFGDSFQIHQSNQSYFYDNIQDLSIFEVVYLKTYYRATDPKLQNILEKYRQDKKISEPLPFEYLTNQRLINQYIQHGWTLLVGKKRAINYYGKKIKYDFCDLSGVMWYYGQRVMTINKYGNCQNIYQIKDYKDGVFILSNNEEIRPQKKGNKVYYLLERADIMTVNLAQGQTLKGVLIDFGSFFEFGSAYTAISRVRRLEDIKMISRPVVIMEADYQNQFIY